MSLASREIAIVGGGLVGASLACALSPLGYQVKVYESVSPRAGQQPSYDDRTLALSHASCRILQGLGLWSALASEATPIREITVTELGRPGRVVLDPGEAGVDSFGHVVEARVFGQAVLQHLDGLDNVTMICPATVTGIQQAENQVRLEFDSGGEHHAAEAALVVAADGAASTARRLLDVPAREKDYGQVAVICNITPEHPHQGRAFERMTPTGPFAILPHRGERCGLVWCVASEAAERLMTMPEADFLTEASARSGGELGTFLRMGKRSSYPLKLTVAEHDRLSRVLVLGNAAHAIHPAGAQGFNLGLRDVAVLAEVLADQSDPGAEDALEAYSAWRRPDQEATIAWTDGLVSLFSSHSAITGAARTLGMLAHSLVPPLRRRLASGAMGYRGRVPRLALGQPLKATTGKLQ